MKKSELIKALANVSDDTEILFDTSGSQFRRIFGLLGNQRAELTFPLFRPSYQLHTAFCLACITSVLYIIMYILKYIFISYNKS